MTRVAAAFLFCLATAATAAAQPPIFLVRHAERADAGMAAANVTGADPELSAAGMARAAALAAMLRDARVNTVYTTEFKRTRLTGEPTATAAGIRVTVFTSKDPSALAAKVKAAEKSVLIVGHSNTIPEIIKALGVTEPVTIADDEYDALFIVTAGTTPSLVRLRYGSGS